MNAKGRIISFLLVVDTFLISYAVAFNSNLVLVVDPSLPAYQAPKVVPVDTTKSVEKPVSSHPTSKAAVHAATGASKPSASSKKHSEHKTPPSSSSPSSSSSSSSSATKSKSPDHKASTPAKTKAPVTKSVPAKQPSEVKKPKAQPSKKAPAEG